jgi:glutathione S-transferase
MESKEADYKLYYFNANGRGCVLRALLSCTSAKWVDERIAFQDWPALKASGKFEWDSLPALETNGKVLTQTMAIELYLAKKYGLIGSSDEDEYEIINLLNTRVDLFNLLHPIYMPGTDEEKSKRDELIENLKNDKLPWFLKKYEAAFTKKGGKYLLGKKFSLGDIYLALVVESVFRSTQVGRDHFEALVKTHAPKLDAHVQELKKKELKNYFEKHHIWDSIL